jgi:predicted MFS family arabinose efflux permease
LQTQPSAGASGTLSRRRELWLLFTLAGIQFTHILDFMIMMPLGPQFTALFGISDAQFGLLVSAYTLAAGASGLVASTYIDRFGRKRLLLTLYGLFALATLACGLAQGYGALMAARIAAGVFGGVLSALSQTIVGDVIPFERRGRAMGIVMTSFSVSTVAGVPLGLFLAAHLNWHAPFFGIAALCAILAVFAALTLPVLDAHLVRAGRPSTWGGIRQVLADRNHQKAFLFSGMLMFAGFTVIPYITIFMQSNAGLRADQVPYVYLCGGIVTLFSARWFGRMTDRAGKVQTFRRLAVAATVSHGGHHLAGPGAAGGRLHGVHAAVHVPERADDSRHGHPHVGGQSCAAWHLHDAQCVGAVGGHGRGGLRGRPADQPRRPGPGAELLDGRLRGRAGIAGHHVAGGKIDPSRRCTSAPGWRENLRLFNHLGGWPQRVSFLLQCIDGNQLHLGGTGRIVV